MDLDKFLEKYESKAKTAPKNSVHLIATAWMERYHFDAKNLPQGWSMGRIMKRARMLYEDCGENIGQAILAIDEGRINRNFWW